MSRRKKKRKSKKEIDRTYDPERNYNVRG